MAKKAKENKEKPIDYDKLQEKYKDLPPVDKEEFNKRIKKNVTKKP